MGGFLVLKSSRNYCFWGERIGLKCQISYSFGVFILGNFNRVKSSMMNYQNQMEFSSFDEYFPINQK